jgi:hypothetical protein
MERKFFAKGVKAKAVSYSQPFAGFCLDLLSVAGVRGTVTPMRASLWPL